MAKKPFMPQSDSARQDWHTNFANKLGTYNTKYGISATELSGVQADEAAMIYWLNFHKQHKEFMSSIVAFKNDLLTGTGSFTEPTPPGFGAAPTAVEAGIINRAISIGMRIKNHKDYKIADGEDLGLEGDEKTVLNPDDMKPTIALKLVADGHVKIIWTKMDSDGIDIYVDRGTGFQYLATDTVPDYVDTFTLPAGAAVWKYKCIYRIDDGHVGQWSDIVSINVSAS